MGDQSLFKNFRKKMLNLLNKILQKISDLLFFLRTLNLRIAPRFSNGEFRFNQIKIRYIDPASFIFMYEEIFRKKIYRFNSLAENPYIIDCGANIGLSIIFFNKLFPQAKILGFEPDPLAFSVLEYNVNQLNSKRIKLVPKGVWTESTTLNFLSDHSDGGRIVEQSSQNSITISTVRLKDYLSEPIDLLKLDIEGAETSVLEDCQEQLHKVKSIFIEYHSYEGEQQTLHKILNILKTAGFRYIIHHIGVFSSQPFTKINISNEMDLQLNIYGTRIEQP